MIWFPAAAVVNATTLPFVFLASPPSYIVAATPAVIVIVVVVCVVVFRGLGYFMCGQQQQ